MGKLALALLLLVATPTGVATPNVPTNVMGTYFEMSLPDQLRPAECPGSTGDRLVCYSVPLDLDAAQVLVDRVMASLGYQNPICEVEGNVQACLYDSYVSGTVHIWVVIRTYLIERGGYTLLGIYAEKEQE